MNKAGAFFKRDFLIDWNSRFSFVFEIFNIVFTVATYLFLSRIVGAAPEGDYFSFVLVGMAANEAMLTALMGLSRGLQLSRPAGVLKPLLFGPTPPVRILLLSSLYPSVRALFGMTLYLAIGGVPLGRANLPGAAAVAGASLAAFGALGIWAAAFTVISRYGERLLWPVLSVCWLLGGVLYPTDVLPAALRWAAAASPLTHALEGLRQALLSGASFARLGPPLLGLALFTLAAFPTGLLLFRWGVRRARVYGTLAEW